jgi:hypothetical protein
MEPELTNTYSENTLWSSEENLELHLNSFYSLIGQSYYELMIKDDAYSDIIKSSISWSEQNVWALGLVTITPSNNVFNNWDWGYAWISHCNRFLDGLGKNGGNFSETTRLRAEAEMRFFRAYVNFCLARRFGASIILHKTLQPIEEKNFPRCTPDECWDFIAADLDSAAKYLPPTPPKGKLNKGIALGMKARAMLYAKRWKAASDAVEALDALGQYDLYPDYAELFTLRRVDGRENKESLLDFGFKAPDFTYVFDKLYCPPGDGGESQLNPTENLVSQYQMADGTNFDWYNPTHKANPYVGRESRFYASILYNGASWKGRTIQSYVGGVDGWALAGGTTPTGYYIRKFLDERLPVQRFDNTTDLTFYFMRYAEALLIYAEAMAEQDHLPEALAALNRVRARAGFTTDVSASNYNDFMTLLRHERMIELAFEGHRFWDLRRWNLAKETLDNTHLWGVKPTGPGSSFTYELVDCDGGSTRIYLDKYARFPIPQSEIQRNILCEQFEEWK